MASTTAAPSVDLEVAGSARHGWLHFEAPGEVARRRRGLLVGVAVLAAVAILMPLAGAPAWAAIVEWALAMCLLVAYGSPVYRATTRGLVHADASGLRVGERTMVRRSEIEAAFLASPEGPVVRVVRRRGVALDVRLDSEEQARALLTALALDVGHAVATFSTWYGGTRRAMAPVMGMLIGTVVIVAQRMPRDRVVLPAAVGAVMVLWHLSRSFARIDVGSDGILIRRPRHRRFISYGSILRVVAIGRGEMALVLASGEELRLSVGVLAGSNLRDAIVERVDEGRTSFTGLDAAQSAEALVAPGGRSVARWLHDMRALAAARDYREARLDDDRLWRVVDDASAPPAVRAGAAVALSSINQASRVRIRVVADACVEPQLRVALASVAEGATDAELEEALAPLAEGTT